MKKSKWKAGGSPGVLSLQVTNGQWERARKYEPSRRPHNSCSDTSDCLRKIIYKRTGVKPSNPLTMSAQDRMSKGTGLQDYIRGKLIPDNTGYKVLAYQPELRLNLTYDVTMEDTGEIIQVEWLGYSDGRLVYQDPEMPDPLLGLEVKTTGSAKKIIDSRLGTKEDHWSKSYPRQGNRYLCLWNDLVELGELPNQPLLNSMLYFIYDVRGFVVKETGGPFMDFTFQINRAEFEKDTYQRAVVERMIRDGEEGPRCYEEPDFWCKGNPEGTGCEYYYKCWGLRKRAPRKPPSLGGITRTTKPKAIRKKAKK